MIIATLRRLYRRAFHFVAATVCSLLLVTQFLAAQSANAFDVQVVTSDSGISAWLVEYHENPIISFEFAFTGGSAHDPAGKSGLANLLSSTLDEGAGPYDSQQLRRILEDESISLSFSSGSRRFYGSLQTLTSSADLAFDLMALSLKEPHFDEEPFARMKRQISNGITSSANQPSTKAGKLFRERYYGDHPFSRDSDGTIESLEAITVEDLRNFKQQHFAREGLLVGVVGDINAEQLKVRLDQLFGDFPEKGETQEVNKAEFKSPGVTEILKVDQPSTIVYFAHDAISLDDPDFLTGMIVDHVLGGGQFSSRLFREIREKRGLTYSVGASLSGSLKSPMWTGSLQADKSKVAEAIDIVRQEWRRMAEEGPTQEEFEKAVDFITGSYALRFSSTKSIASSLLGLQISKLPKDYPEKREALFRAITLEDVKRVAKRILHEDRLMVVIAGEPEGL